MQSSARAIYAASCKSSEWFWARSPAENGDKSEIYMIRIYLKAHKSEIYVIRIYLKAHDAHDAHDDERTMYDGYCITLWWE